MIWTTLGHQKSGKTRRLSVILRALFAQRCREYGRPPVVLVHDQRAGMSETLGNLCQHHWESPHHWQPSAGISHAFYECDPESVAELARRYAKRRASDGSPTPTPVILAIDELDQAAQRLSQKKSAIYWVANYGRRYHCDVIGSGRRPANLDKSLLSESWRIDLFRVTESATLEWIRKAGWPNAEFYARALPTLPRWHYYPVDLIGEPRGGANSLTPTSD